MEFRITFNCDYEYSFFHTIFFLGYINPDINTSLKWWNKYSLPTSSCIFHAYKPGNVWTKFVATLELNFPHCTRAVWALCETQGNTSPDICFPGTGILFRILTSRSPHSCHSVITNSHGWLVGLSLRAYVAVLCTTEIQDNSL